MYNDEELGEEDGEVYGGLWAAQRGRMSTLMRSRVVRATDDAQKAGATICRHSGLVCGDEEAGGARKRVCEACWKLRVMEWS